MKTTTIRDIDGTVYTVTWADDERSAKVTRDDHDVCIVYLSRRSGLTIWSNTGQDDVYHSPELAIMGYFAHTRRSRIVATPVQQTKIPPPVIPKKRHWTEILDAPAKPAPQHRERKDWD